MEQAANGKLLAKNTMAMYVRTAIVMIVSLYVTRALLTALGESDFGIYNIVGSVVIFFSFLNSSITQAIQRFLTFELGRGDKDSTKNVFQSSLFIQLLVVVILVLLCETLGLWFLKNGLNIPEERMDVAFWVFQFSTISFSIGILRSPFEAMVIAYEKLSFFAYASIFDSLIRLGIVFVLMNSHMDRLFEYGILVAIEAVLMLALYAVFCKKKFEICSFRPRYDKQCFTQMSSYFGWNLMGNATNVATQQGFSFMLNIFYGVVVNAAMGVANQVLAAVSSFVSGFQTAFRPQIVKAYSQEDIPSLNRLVSSTSRISFLLVFFPALLIIVNAPLILQLWLKDVPEYTTVFCRLILVCCVLDGISGPFYCAVMASRIIRNYQIVISSVFLADLLFSYLLFKLGVGVQHILYCRILTRGVINFFVGLAFIKRMTGFCIRSFMRTVLVPIFLFAIACSLVSVLLMESLKSWALLGISSAIILLVMMPLAFFVLLAPNERKSIVSIITNRLN